MARRYTGGLLSSKEQVTDANSASGIFSVQEAGALTAAGAFPTGRWAPSRSLRFRRSASAYLTRTPSVASGQNQWTLSTWVKRGFLGDSASQIIGGNTTTSGNVRNVQLVEFGSDNALWVYAFSNASGYYFQRTSNQLFRDPSAWYHLVVQFDPDNAVSDNKVIAFVNGQRLTWSTASDSGAAGNIGSSSYRSINNTFRNDINGGYQGGGAPIYFGDQYLSEMYMVSGSLVSPSSFIQTDPQTGTLIPKQYTGSYGTNGFYLDFRDNTSTTNLALDRSGNSNNFTPNGISVSGATATTVSFTSVGTTSWTVPPGITSVNYLVVAGGGAGGSAGPTMYDGGAAGGGAGGMLYGTMAVTPGTVYSIYVGAGASGAANRTRGASGDNSVLSSSSTSITAIGGGGGGGGANTQSGANGGSGGGGANGGAAGLGTAGQGSNGGYYVGSPGNGGGGAGGIGGSATNNNGANGGLGQSWPVNSTTYAGGGGGGGYQLSGGSGGSSIGGNGGSNNSNGSSATASTGSGGGGSGGTYNTSGTLTGGSGANGIIIVSYATIDSTYDSMVDVPGIAAVTSQPDWGGVQRGNYAVLSQLSAYNFGGTLSNGNLSISYGDIANNRPTMAVSSGKWYSEITCTSAGGYSGTGLGITVNGPDVNASEQFMVGWYYNNGQTYNYSTDSYTSYGASWGTGDVIGVAWDCDNRTVTFYKNGVSQGLLSAGVMYVNEKGIGTGCAPCPTAYGTGVTTTFTANYGQRPFAYFPPAGFKSLCSTNLPNPVIKRPSEQFDVKTWTGNGTSLQVGATQKQTSAYPINKSLRFRKANSSYLSRTPSTTGNQKKWTWSGWVKQSLFGTSGTQWIMTSGNSGSISTNYTSLSFSANGFLGNANQLQFYSTLSNSTVAAFESSQKFGDSTEWCNVVLAVDTAQVVPSQRVRMYVDGVQITSFATQTYPGLSVDIPFINSSSYETRIGGIVSYGSFDGYMTEINFVDGQALTPSSFGAFDANNNWVPQRYAGTYGTQGYYLPFNDNTSTTTLGYDRQLGFTDSSKNNWTSNGISVTTGVTYDSMFDSPTDTVDSSGNIVGNYCIIDSNNNSGLTISNGGLSWVGAGSTPRMAYGTLPFSSGKWYFEYTMTQSNNGGNWAAGFSKADLLTTSGSTPFDQPYTWGIMTGGNASVLYKVNNNVFTNLSGLWTGSLSGAVIGVAVDYDAGKVWFSKDNVWVEGDPSAGTTPSYTGINAYGQLKPIVYGYNTGDIGVANFGQRAFAYTPPTGFRSLNSKNLKDIGSYNLPDTFGNFVNTPDLVWIKNRSSTNAHQLSDSVRGVNNALASDLTIAQYTGQISAFNPNGFEVTGAANATNSSGQTYVGWAWNRGKTPGFDIVNYGGDGVNGRMIPHNLGQAPAFYITKCLTSYNNTQGFNDWSVYHQSCPTYTGNSKMGKQALWLHSILGAANGVGGFFNTATSTEFSPNQINYDNSSGQSYIAYLWAEVPGFSKFGGYTGNNDNNGPFIYLGFRPRFILLKKIGEASTTYGWQIYDTARSPNNLANLPGFWADTTAAEAPNTYAIDLVSNGFKLRSNNLNMNNTSTFVYAAWAESPFKYANAR